LPSRRSFSADRRGADRKHARRQGSILHRLSKTAIDDESLTVSRAATGKNSSTKTFVVTEATRFEGGKPQVRARVTVRYITTEDGDRAVHVILRRARSNCQ